MKLGVFNPVFQKYTLEETCEILSKKGIHMMEIGCGGTPGNHHCNPDILLNDEAKFNEFKATLEKYDIQVSAFSVQDNPVHPDKEYAAKADKAITDACKMAQKMGVDVICVFSGCPSEGPEGKMPNWVTCSWPPEYTQVLEWQWNDVLIPYWKKKAEECKSYGIHKIAFEMHPGFCVYNPYTLLKLREAVGPEIGANFDPSHLIWQGVDPVAAIRELGKHKAIYHFHAKDTNVDKYNTAINGVLDTRHYSDEVNRSWKFRSVGCGHDLCYWKDIMTELRLAGYDYAISIEHEDSMMSMMEGLDSAISTLNQCIMTQPRMDMFWA